VSFLHPLALLGLAAAAIPALLHLLQRRTPPELEFPAVRYLSAAERESARRMKLRHLLLLILRTALIVMIVLAAARPLVRFRGGGGGSHEPTALVVILDNSPSSGAVADGRPILERLRATAHASIAQSTPADRLWLILADGVIRGGTREALLASVDSAAVGWQRLDLVQAVERAARLVHAEPLPGREVHVLSDMQRTAMLAGRAEVPQGVRVLTLEPRRATPPNRGIASVQVSEGAALIEVVGSTQPVPVTVRVGMGSSGAGAVGDRAEVAGRALAAGGSAVAVPLPAQSLAPGWRVGESVLEPDELRADDRRPFAWRVAPPARVTATEGAGPFVAAALTVLRDARRISDGRDVVITAGEAPAGARVITMPPADPALVGQANRALAARGVAWRWGTTGSPGPIAASDLPIIQGAQVTRRYRLEPAGTGEEGSASVLASVNGEPWLIRASNVTLLGSRLDTAWTALPAAPGFVPFVDALANRLVAGEAEVASAEGAPRVEFQLRGVDTIGATVYGPDRRESDLTPATSSLINAAFGGGDGIEVLSESRFGSSRFAGTRRADTSSLLLVLALLLAGLELGVATRTR
jgi:hypothetical protein